MLERILVTTLILALVALFVVPMIERVGQSMTDSANMIAQVSHQ